MPPRRRTPSSTAARPEATTRRERIDPALKQAGWDVADPTRVGLEIPVDGYDPAAWQLLQAGALLGRAFRGELGDGVGACSPASAARCSTRSS